MSTPNKKRISELVWKRRATDIRSKLLPKLVDIGEYVFYGEKQSLELGGRFWNKVEELKYTDPNDLDKVLEALASINNEQRVIWFHRYTNDAGAIEVKLERLVGMIKILRYEFGPDILVAGLSFEFGICFEEGESDSYLRYWGLLVPDFS